MHGRMENTYHYNCLHCISCISRDESLFNNLNILSYLGVHCLAFLPCFLQFIIIHIPVTGFMSVPCCFTSLPDVRHSCYTGSSFIPKTITSSPACICLLLFRFSLDNSLPGRLWCLCNYTKAVGRSCLLESVGMKQNSMFYYISARPCTHV